MQIKLAQIAEWVEGELTGDPELAISGVAPIDRAGPGEITLLSDLSSVHRLETTDASCVVVPLDCETTRCATIRTENPWEAMSEILLRFFPPKIPPPGIDPSARVGEDVTFGEGVSVGCHVYIGGRSRIGDGVVVFPGAYIGDGSTVGKDSIIYPNVTLREGVSIGERVVVHSGSVIGSDGFGYTRVGETHKKIPQVGGVIIEDDVEIGANVSIDRGTMGSTKVGRGTKIDNLVHLGHNVVIGENTLLVAQVGIAGSTEIGSGCILAGQAGIVEHITLGDGVVVGAQSGVMKSFPAHTKISGYPARPHAESKRAYAALFQLPSLLSRISRLESELARLTKRDG